MTPPRPTSWTLAGLALPAVIGLPLAAGLAGVVAPAFGVHPGLGATRPTFDVLAGLLTDPSFGRALALSVMSGLGASLLAVAAAFGFCALAAPTRWFARVRPALAAGLALPHASFAVGLAFLVAPSGFIARAVSPELTGWREPPDFLLVGDPWAVSLLAALALKETLFLILMITAALGQFPAESLLRTARSLGYRPLRGWLMAVAPQAYRRVRLPVYAVIASSLGSVDLALVLGPSSPPPLAPLLLRWFTDFDPLLQQRAAAGALVLLAATLLAILAWRLGERGIAAFARVRLLDGDRGGGALDRAVGAGAGGIVGLSLAVSTGALIVLALWSVAAAWPWPEALPRGWTLAQWGAAWPTILRLAGDTLLVAALSTAVALALAIAALEARPPRPDAAIDAVVLTPLLLPQAGFLFGVQVMWSALRWDGAIAAVVCTHLLFVGPYVYLALRDPFHALDPRLARSARSLGKSRLVTLLQVKLPLLLRPLLTATAIGLTVSVTLYLPTIIAGAGRVTTLATETIALSAGGDRRLLGVVAITLAALPFAALRLALGLGAWAARRRRGLAA
ncbi:MAG: ABC transporter permease subunit [Alphaproteobacteria bacterium]|nr:ABC transporter permease subunit [Alphaproteobacteria bacterium]